MTVMKKFIYIVSVLLFAAIGCTKEIDQTIDVNGQNGFPEGARVTVTFSIPTPPETKGSMGVNPDIDNLYVAVFNSAGILKEYNKAEAVGVTENGQWKEYKVSLLLSSTERRLHFIANGPTSLDVTSGGNELSIIRAMEDEGGNASYWQRVVLNEGVKPQAADHEYVDENEVHVNIGDYIDVNGNKILDGTGYIADKTTLAALNKIPLIRNFARVTVIGGEHFYPVQFALINTPSKGYVAPYDEVHSVFVQPYMDAYVKVAQSYIPTLDEIKATGYQANMPHDATIEKLTEEEELEALLKNVYSSEGEYEAATFNPSDAYCGFSYERSTPTETETPTCVVVSGYLLDRDPDKEELRWFKIEVNDKDGNYLPLYRDVTYVIQISSIMGTPGYDSAWEAYNSPSVGDVSSSPTTQTLNQISDGKGTTLWVEYIDYTSVEPNGETKTILYKLFTATENLTGGTVVVDGETKPRVTLTVKNSSVDPAIDSQTITGSPAPDGTQTPDGTGGWYIATVPLLGNADGIFKKSTLHIEGLTKDGGGRKAVYRNVDYRVTPMRDLTVTKDNDGEDIKLTITLPKDLGFSMFPLVLKIEAETGDLNPAIKKNSRANVFGDTDASTKNKNVDLPTEYGASMFTDPAHTGRNTFYFLFTVNFSDYDQANGSTYNVYFEKTRSNGLSSEIRIQDKKPFFNLKPVSLQ